MWEGGGEQLELMISGTHKPPAGSRTGVGSFDLPAQGLAKERWEISERDIP